ncbi:MAG: hypothetical protein NZ521_05825 [Flammeovirgaceae bacterium]|nr:hypothetical protein [Flammeovirgaceae bacterium]MDW8287753.1 hypothetical protein [Flammeovirgaceae bacterium]
MAKKNFSGGLESLLSGVATEQPVISSTNQEVSKKEETSKKEITTQENSVPSTAHSIELLLGQYRLNKLKAIAERDKLALEEVLKEAIDFYLEFQVEIL